MSYDAFPGTVWPFVFILLAGWLATDIWRFLGVFLGGRIDADSEVLVLVRAVATALVAAVIANLVLYPAGALADISIALRVGAILAGFAAYLALGRRVIVAIVVAEAVLVGGMLSGL